MVDKRYCLRNDYKEKSAHVPYNCNLFFLEYLSSLLGKISMETMQILGATTSFYLPILAPPHPHCSCWLPWDAEEPYLHSVRRELLKL